MLVLKRNDSALDKAGPRPAGGPPGSLSRPFFQSGLAIVELAAVGFVLALVLAGVTTYGVRFYQKNTLTKAIQDASRYYAMRCGTDGHGSSTTGAYGGALAILTANIAGLKVKENAGDSPKQPTVAFVDARTTVTGLEGPADSTPCANSPCGSGCEYIRLQAPGNSYLFSNNYQIASTISATNRIMR